jgi:hypothetical protein
MKKMLFVFVLMLSCLISTLVVNTVLAQNVSVLEVGDGNGFQCTVYAPTAPQANQEFSIWFDIIPIFDSINVNSIVVSVMQNAWQYSWTNMTMLAKTDYIANNTYLLSDVGQTIFGEITASYTFNGKNYFVFSDFYIATLYPALTYSDLAQNYNSLNQSYVSLNVTYNSLKSNLDLYQGIAVTLLVTTIVFALISAILFARRRKEYERKT